MMKNIITLLIITIFFSCNSSKGNLEEKVDLYKQSFITRDYIRMSTLFHPKVIYNYGGRDEFVKIMNSIPQIMADEGMDLDFSKIDFAMLGDIHEIDNFLACIVRAKLPCKMGDDDIVVETSLVCISEDNGKMWYFFDDTSTSKISLAELYPQVYQTLGIPPATTTVNGVIYNEDQVKSDEKNE